MLVGSCRPTLDRVLANISTKCWSIYRPIVSTDTQLTDALSTQDPKNFTVPFLNCRLLKLLLRVFLAGLTVAMVTYCVMKRSTTCSLIVGQFFDSMIVASSDKEWLQ